MGRNPKTFACVGAGIVLAFGLVTGASARTITLRWNHPAPSEVEGFRVAWGDTSRTAAPYDTSIDVGKPAAVNGVFTASVVVPDHTVYVALRAYNAEGVSPLSNERSNTYDGGTTPPPPPPPPADTAQVLGFALWNAETDRLIDGSLQNSDRVLQDQHGDCLAINILVNDYLSRSNSPGSVKFAFDSPVPTSCTTPGRTHENEPPYAWEKDYGPAEFECAPSLAVPGSHTLTVVPYSGDGCSGVAGSTISVSFEVVGPGGGSGSGSELGLPGRPFLVQ